MIVNASGYITFPGNRLSHPISGCSFPFLPISFSPFHLFPFSPFPLLRLRPDGLRFHEKVEKVKGDVAPERRTAVGFDLASIRTLGEPTWGSVHIGVRPGVLQSQGRIVSSKRRAQSPGHDLSVFPLPGPNRTVRKRGGRCDGQNNEIFRPPHSGPDKRHDNLGH